ncbi:MAG: hypothetical protein HOP12_08420 [Candidatus Eisenbacteria bacterium]|uniref:TonB C-terminal domain-containing protein n=1 Tax=Eiseniibacteriota bacterium TaxID=2212470 RepID=A0A849SHX2_UNCEI|nr:hypothetical protein [Candidatus Eisenbacteria bacterium]
MARPIAVTIALAITMSTFGCEPGARDEAPTPHALPVDVRADTAAPAIRLSQRWRSDSLAEPPAADARMWLARVSPTRAAESVASVTPVAELEVPLPTPEPGTPEPSMPEPPGLVVDEDLKPPIPRGRATLLLPHGARAGSVELDVRVDEQGVVSDVEWAGGSTDSALVGAATTSAFSMRFFPALQSGRPRAVWCRQRFDFGRR